MKLIKDMGMQFATENSKTKLRHGVYECPSCFKHFRCATSNVKRGNTKSCRKCGSKVTAKKNTKHGQRSHHLYPTYRQQIDRCENINNINYSCYGGRGIVFSEEFKDINKWIKYVEGLENYRKKDYTLDRIDNDKGYEKGNLRWASKEIQVQNTRKLRSSNTSGYRGVSWCKHANKWLAQICVNYNRINLGLYDSLEKASKAYDKYVIDNKLNHTINK